MEKNDSGSGCGCLLRFAVYITVLINMAIFWWGAKFGGRVPFILNRVFSVLFALSVVSLIAWYVWGDKRDPPPAS